MAQGESPWWGNALGGASLGEWLHPHLPSNNLLSLFPPPCWQGLELR